jgi:hypothetical protein
MRKDMLARFEEMRYDARDRHIRITGDQLCQLVIADVIEDASLALIEGIDEVDKSLVVINQNI